MNAQPITATIGDSNAYARTTATRLPSPPPGVVAIIFTVIKLACISVVSIVVTQPPFPAPTAAMNDVVAYFQSRPIADT